MFVCLFVDGKLFNLEEAWKLFKQNYIQENMYSVLTQNVMYSMLRKYLFQC